MSLTQQIEQIIEKTVTDFFRVVSKKYDIPIATLTGMWNETRKKPNLSTSTPPLSTPNSRRSSVSSSVCPYVFVRGGKKGETCGVVSKPGLVYCSTHKKYEDIEPRESKIRPIPKKPTPKLKPEEKVIRPHPKLGVLFHKPTNLVFSLIGKSRVVSQKVVDEELSELEDDDIKTCAVWRFKLHPDVKKKFEKKATYKKEEKEEGKEKGGDEEKKEEKEEENEEKEEKESDVEEQIDNLSVKDCSEEEPNEENRDCEKKIQKYVTKTLGLDEESEESEDEEEEEDEEELMFE